MSTIITIIVVILAFSFLILIHELGHFLMAKRAGIKVLEFAIGFPPRLWCRKKGETRYCINAIPFGGYVKLYGEDSSDPKVLKSKVSFAGKSLRQRIKVVIGGVAMNFIAAFLLFTIGFSIGMKPIIPDVGAINNGIIEIKSGVVIKEISLGENSAYKIPAGSLLEKINLKNIAQIKDPQKLLEGKIADQNVNEEISLGIRVNGNYLNVPFNPQKDTIRLYDFSFLPRLQIYNVKPDSAAAKANIQAGDIIISINGRQINLIDDLNEELQKGGPLEMNLIKTGDNQWKEIKVNLQLPIQHKAMVIDVNSDSIAERAGIQKGDIIIEINDFKPAFAQSAINEILRLRQEKAGEEILITVLRNGTEKKLKATLEKDRELGVYVSTIYPYENSQFGISTTFVPTSIIKVNNLQYPPHVAAWESLKLMKDLGLLTGDAFIKAIGSIFVKFSIPEEIGGAVAITSIIHQKTQDGPMDVLQIIAYLSLILAVINILPLPALDGGRLFFLFAEGIVGRRLNPKWEAWIHTFGFILLFIMIIAVTYNDILRLL